MSDELPIDDLAVQLPGRLLAVEIVLTLLLRRKTDAARILAGAETILSTIEADEMHRGPEQSKGYALNYFAAARMSLDKMAEEARRR